MDRNMITVMTGQVVDFFDRDFRELYAISEKLDLYKEFHISPPAVYKTETVRSKRPPLPATTSRFQVSLGGSPKADIQVPAHKYYNPKYLLALGNVPRPPSSLQERGPKRGSFMARCPGETILERERLASSEKMDRLSPLPSDAPSEIFQTVNAASTEKKTGFSAKRLSKGKSSSKISFSSLEGNTAPSPTTTRAEEDDDRSKGTVLSPSKAKGKKSLKLGWRTESEQVVNTAPDNESKSRLNRYKD